MSQAKVANITNLAGTKTITTDDLIDRATCRAWVSFDEDGSSSSSSRFNVSGVTHHGTGTYQVLFTNNMPDTGYAAVFGCRNGQDSNDANHRRYLCWYSKSLSSIYLFVGHPGGTSRYNNPYHVAIFR